MVPTDNTYSLGSQRKKTGLLTHEPVLSPCWPAGAKIGEYKGHSSYFACHRCHYKGAICAHVRLPDDNNDDPIVYDNVNFDPETMSEDDRVLLTGEARKKRRGEHIVWLDADLIPREKLVNEDDLRTSQIKVHKRITNTPSWEYNLTNY